MVGVVVVPPPDMLQEEGHFFNRGRIVPVIGESPRMIEVIEVLLVIEELIPGFLDDRIEGSAREIEGSRGRAGSFTDEGLML